MNGDIALNTSVAIRFLNGDKKVTQRLYACQRIFLPTVAVGELLFGAENSNRSFQNLPRYQEFVEACEVLPLGKATAVTYAQTRLALKRKGRPIPINDVWIAAQCLENKWTLATNDSDFSHVDGLVLERW